MRPIAFQLAFVLLAILCGRPASAQCSLEWSSGGPQPQLSGSGSCSTLWDPDGAGPLPERLVIGGHQLMAGDGPTDQTVMTWDGTRWEALGNGPVLGAYVNELVTWNGFLVAGGSFSGGGFQNIALWVGSQWQPLGTGFPVMVSALAVWNGTLVAAGNTFPGPPTPVIRTWNGVTWSALPAPPLLDSPLAMTPFQGLLCVGGYKASPYQGVLERWNGTSWSASITADTGISTLAARAFQLVSTLFVGGTFSSIGGVAANNIASTSGGTTFTFNPVGVGLPAGCQALHARNLSGFTYALVAVIYPPHTVMQLSGSSWVTMGVAPLASLSYYGGSYHGASYTPTHDNACQRYDGSSWVPVRGPGLDGEVRASTRIDDDVIVGGTFGATASGAMSRIARWNGSSFQPLGAGISGTSVDALVALDNGDVVAGGLFSAAGGANASNIARWNGSAWSFLGFGADQQVLALCKMPNGDVVAGGKFASAGGLPCSRIARWSATGWATLGSGMNGDVHALALRGDGVLFAGGAFTTAGGVTSSRIAQWDGSAWAPVGAGCDGDVLGLAVRPNGDVVAVGAFTNAGGSSARRCARWTGTSWFGMGAPTAGEPPVRAALAMPNGDVVVGHGFHTHSAPDEGIARWNGSTWSGVGTLEAHHYLEPVSVRTLTQTANGDIVVGGTFSVADGAISRNLAMLASTCMPQAMQYGSGCSSTAGQLVLNADTLPWTGASFRTTTTGIAPLSLCLAVIGFTQLSIPLDSLIAQGQPGCSLLTSLDIVTWLLPDSAGTVHSALALPPDPGLLGAAFFQQSIPLEFDGSGALVAVRGSNALAAVIGRSLIPTPGSG